MKYQIRKSESITILRCTESVELDDKKFRKLSDNPYTGETQEDFMNYIAGLDLEDLPYDLDDKTAQKLYSLQQSEWTEYASSLDKGSNVWLQIGAKDESYWKTGGFRVDDQTETV